LNPEQGALGSVYCLHRIASLNHRFRVFQGVEEEEEEQRDEREEES
jgi:tRNA(Arg) A34 adenosine deaminase TadA